MKGDPGDLRPIRTIHVPFWCERCCHRIDLKATLYNAGIADLLEDGPTTCPGCLNEVRWLSEEEERKRYEAQHPLQPKD